MIHYADFFPEYPNTSDNLFQQKILNKKEFLDYKLNEEQELLTPNQPYLNHQVLVSRFLSTYTPYDETLVYHEMGTGKTCVAFALTESLKNKSPFKRTYVFARGNDLLVSLMRNLVYSCSQAYTIEIDPEKKKDFRTEMAAIRKVVKDFYTFHTFLTFAREISNLSDEVLVNRYSNSVFIIDEVHNIKGDADAIVYAQFHRLLHLTRNRKVLLMSGTPMRDDVNELADIMNLILPITKQLPTGKQFTQQFLKTLPDQTSEPTNVELLKTYLRGRISFLKAPPEPIPVKYMGEKTTPIDIPQFRLVYLNMSDFQSRGYLDALSKDTSKTDSGIYSNTQQALLFVFPDGSYGEVGLKKYTQGTRHNVSKTLANEVKTLDKLKIYSIKYATTINHILQNPNQNIYVYCSRVNGSGAILFARILELYGFQESMGTEKLPSKRYILLTSQTANIARRIAYFNRDSNAQGAYCQIIIGSRKIAEGYSFKNVLKMHDLTLHWNYTETVQAQFRIRRFKSHQVLHELGKYEPIEIYNYAALPTGSKVSLDTKQNDLSRIKDISQRRMDRIIKMVSWDCPLTYERNVSHLARAGSRECDYESCDYVCDSSQLIPQQLDVSTYELYYDNFSTIIDVLVSIFEHTTRASYQTLYETIHPTTNMELLKCLDYLSSNNIPIKTTGGITGYLRESYNMYFLVPTVASLVPLPRRGPLVTQVTSLADMMKREALQDDLKALDLLEEAKDFKDASTEIAKLSPQTQIALLQKALLHKTSKNEIIGFVLAYFAKNVHSTNEYPIIIVIGEQSSVWNPRMREWESRQVKLKEKKRKPASPKLAVVAAHPTSLPTKIKNNPVGYEGIVGRTEAGEERFCIQDLTKASSTDKRKRTTGAVCLEAGWKKSRLIDLWKELQVDRSDATKLKSFTKKELCNSLQQWFYKQKLLRQGECGKNTKKKT